MVRPYSWLLDRVGDDGIKLTGAGYLPAHVAAAMAELGLRRNGPARATGSTRPCQYWSCVRRRSGWGCCGSTAGSVLTPAGLAVRADPVSLWWHLAERMPPRSRDACEQQAGLLRLVLVAAGAAGDHDATIARLLTAIGWMVADGLPLTGASRSRRPGTPRPC